jgi:predicted nucleic acid-binding protein
MILLDTNVLSALLRPEQDIVVVNWLNRFDDTDLCTNAVSVFELRFGIARLPNSKRKSKLAGDLAIVLDEVLGNRVLTFNGEAAVAAADLRARRSRAGQSIDIADTLIAGIALANGYPIATRNGRHFADLAIDVIDPWAGQS